MAYGLKDYDGRDVIIEDVLYVPGLNTSLLSLGQLLQKGLMMTMKSNSLSVFDTNKRLVIHSDIYGLI